LSLEFENEQFLFFSEMTQIKLNFIRQRSAYLSISYSKCHSHELCSVHVESTVIEVGEKSPKSYLVLPLAPVTKEKD
jgi:hypothetical protein